MERSAIRDTGPAFRCASCGLRARSCDQAVLPYRCLARIELGTVGLGRELRVPVAWPLEGGAELLAGRGDRLGGGLRALLDPLHHRVEGGGEFRRALAG